MINIIGRSLIKMRDLKIVFKDVKSFTTLLDNMPNYPVDLGKWHVRSCQESSGATIIVVPGVLWSSSIGDLRWVPHFRTPTSRDRK